jgi:ABC-type glycerol-3-phosphate transport system substrate-binding protein
MTRQPRRMLVGLAAAISLTAALTAGGAASAATNGGCTLKVLGSTRANKGEEAGWNKVFADFKAAYGCTVTATWQGQFPDVPQELNEARLAHQQVDIVTTATDENDQAKAGNLLDLTKIVKPFSSKFTAGALQRFTIGGHVWAIPVAVQSSSVMFYNQGLFKKLKLAPPTTYPQLVHVASVIKAKTKVQPLTEGGKDTWEWPMWYMSTFAQTSKNHSIAETQAALAGTRTFTAPDSVAALADLAKFGKDGLLTQSALDTDENGAVAAFLQQKAAMFFDGTWVLPSLRSGKPPFTIGVFRFPLMGSARGVVSQPSGAPENGLAIPSFAPKGNLKMAAQFLEFVTRKKEATLLLNPLNPLVPSIKSVPSSNDPLAATLRQKFLPDTIGWLDWIWPNDVNNAVIQSIEGVLFNHQSPTDAAQGMQDALKKVQETQHYKYNWWTTWSSSDWAKVTPSSVPAVQVKA